MLTNSLIAFQKYFLLVQDARKIGRFRCIAQRRMHCRIQCQKTSVLFSTRGLAHPALIRNSNDSCKRNCCLHTPLFRFDLSFSLQRWLVGRLFSQIFFSVYNCIILFFILVCLANSKEFVKQDRRAHVYNILTVKILIDLLMKNCH